MPAAQPPRQRLPPVPRPAFRAGPPPRASARRAATGCRSTSTTTTAPPRSEEAAMLLTRKSSSAAVPQARLARGLPGPVAKTIDRRAFLKRSGITLGAGALATQLPFNMIGKAEAADAPGEGGKIEVRRTVCTHCSVGCAIDAVVQNGVWIRQEPVFDSPLNLGAHCAKGASVREHGMTEHRLKYPMKLVDGKYKKISWEQALNEVSEKLLAIRKESGPDATYWVGSSKHSNEQSYLLCKFVRLFG